MLPLLLPAALSGASFLGGLFGNKGKQMQKGTSTTTPTLAPEFRGIQDVLIKNITDRLSRPSALPASYAAGQTSDINHTYDLANQGLANRLSAAGLSTSPIAGAGQRYLAGQRGSEIVRMKQQIPLINRQLQDQDLASALSLMNFGRGETTNSTGEISGGGSRLGGGISSLASMLGFLYGSGAFGRSPTGSIDIPGTGGTIDPFNYGVGGW